METKHPIIESILKENQAAFGPGQLDAYRNHVYRMFNFTLAFCKDVTKEEKDQIAIAAAFHDIGIWTHDTFDYLPPSNELALKYLGKTDGRTQIILNMIEFHHKIRPFKGSEIVNAFRKADYVDLTLGSLKFGLDKKFIQEVQGALPNLGFHWKLVRMSIRRILTRPWSPVPMFRL